MGNFKNRHFIRVAEKLDKAFRTEVSRHCKRDGRHYHFDPFWAIKYGGESEWEKGHGLLTQTMSTVLANHGIDPDSLLESDQGCVRQLDWDGRPDSQLALAS